MKSQVKFRNDNKMRLLRLLPDGEEFKVPQRIITVTSQRSVARKSCLFGLVNRLMNSMCGRWTAPTICGHPASMVTRGIRHVWWWYHCSSRIASVSSWIVLGIVLLIQDHLKHKNNISINKYIVSLKTQLDIQKISLLDLTEHIKMKRLV